MQHSEAGRADGSALCGGQLQNESSATAFASFTVDSSLVSFGDLANECEAESDAAIGAGLPGGSVETFEDSFSLRFGNAWPAIGDDEPNGVAVDIAMVAVMSQNLDVDGRLAVAYGVLQKIPDQSAQQPWVAVDHLARAVDINAIDSCSFLRGESQEVDVFAIPALLRSVETTGNQQLSNQIVQFVDVERDPREEIRSWSIIEKSDRHANSRQGRSQFM